MESKLGTALINGSSSGIAAIYTDRLARRGYDAVSGAVGKRKSGGAFVVQVAPHIVKETAIVARQLYGDLATITFTYVDLSNTYALRT